MVKVSEVMRKYVVTVDPSFNMYTAAKIMTNNRIGSVVVVDNGGKAIGIVTIEDIATVVSKGLSPKNVSVREFTEKDFVTAKSDDNLLDVVKKMNKRGVKRIPIIDNDKLEGIVSDKEVILTTPEMVGILSEKLKARVEKVARPNDSISGICEKCESYSNTLRHHEGRWLCTDCSSI